MPCVELTFRQIHHIRSMLLAEQSYAIIFQDDCPDELPIRRLECQRAAESCDKLLALFTCAQDAET